ncbi:MAG: radical SAM protein [Thermoguttaceae bacterium]
MSDAVYAVLDDYRVLTPDEILEKYSALGNEAVQEALADLDEAQSRGLLCDHLPEISAKVQYACYQEKPEPLHDFLRHHRRLLTLELTQQCNLACEYCVFGKHYDRRRQPSDAPMSLDTAKSAVARFMSHKPAIANIGFYGGEPLLEFELMKEVVAFAEKHGAESGIERRFSITTNGTLLSEEKIHFLVAHEFAVFISLDGNKKTQDRYRVFKSTQLSGKRRGSYDVVIRNMERFVELYPEYDRRGIALTLTATADLSEVEQFMNRWSPSFPTSVPNVVSTVHRSRGAAEGDRGIQVGECRSSACTGESCLRTPPPPDGHCEVPEFDDWSTGRLAAAIRSGVRSLLSQLCQSDCATAEQLCKDSPICAVLLREEIERIHHRSVVGRAAQTRPVTRLSCFPGATRTFCSTQGALFPCERVDFDKLFEIGDATSDVHGDKACNNLVEAVRLGCDCGNCITDPVCSLCPTSVTESRASPGNPDYSELRHTCRQLASELNLIERLKKYTEIMEANPTVLDHLYPARDGGGRESWLSDVKVVLVKQEDVQLTVEELEDFADVC